MTRRLALGLFVVALGALPPLTGAADGPSDAWLTTTAKIAILTSIGTRGSTLQVDTRNATLTLYGKVGSAADTVNAEKSARTVEGVKDVRNLLMIAPVANDGSAVTSDADLQSEVAVALIAAALGKDSPLGGSNVTVQSVDKGTVFLSGRANSLAAHLLAIDTARRVRGVRAVRSDIQTPDVRAVYQARFLGR